MFEKLASMQQRGAVEDYVQEFETLVAQTRGVTEEQLMWYFFSGATEQHS